MIISFQTKVACGSGKYLSNRRCLESDESTKEVIGQERAESVQGENRKKTEENRREQKRTEENRREQKRTKVNRSEKKRTEENRREQKGTKVNRSEKKRTEENRRETKENNRREQTNGKGRAFQDVDKEKDANKFAYKSQKRK